MQRAMPFRQSLLDGNFLEGEGMQTLIKRVSLFAALVLVITMCLSAVAGPALAWWPMSGHPAMPFGGQPPTEMHATVAYETPEALYEGLYPGELFANRPHPGETLTLGWRFVAQWDSATGPWADRVTGYVLFKWHVIERTDATANTHWGTSIITSADPADSWPCLPPKSTWLWTGRFQGVTFASDVWGLHSIQEQWTGCNQNRGLKAYLTWAFDNPWDVYGQAWVVRGFRH